MSLKIKRIKEIWDKMNSKKILKEKKIVICSPEKNWTRCKSKKKTRTKTWKKILMCRKSILKAWILKNKMKDN